MNAVDTLVATFNVLLVLFCVGIFFLLGYLCGKEKGNKARATRYTSKEDPFVQMCEAAMKEQTRMAIARAKEGFGRYMG